MRSLLQAVVDSGQVPDGEPRPGERLALKLVWADWTAYDRLSYWQPGVEWIEDGKPFDPQPGVAGGLHVSETANGLRGGGQSLGTGQLLLVAYRDGQAGPPGNYGQFKVPAVRVVCPMSVWSVGVSEAGLANVDLSLAFLTRADLEFVDLSGAYLHTAALYQANLTGANLSGADMRWANLEMADGWRANMRQANLTDAGMEHARLIGADLRDATLVAARMGGTNLSRANLEAADLEAADLSGANLRDADLTGVNLEGTIR